MDKDNFKGKEYSKRELVDRVNNLRMTVKERISLIAKIESHPKASLGKKDLEEIGLVLVDSGKFTRLDWMFFLREIGCDLWMAISGAVIIVGGWWVADPFLRALAALFGAGGVMVGSVRMKSLLRYAWSLKAGDVQ